ncbi:ABC transporter ATP-binding protein [Chroococcus sp. FPU101]|uniref:ABC transporter ATP-binding protein n=1 Tax=Chroococcus sp. FPU101 TaxID=1974212 RepID=UPI001A8F490A|nr:ABC transporter ATP-binding protein [Chroococcus sp. FPU101]GFE71020.1 ABC transporter related [Chroococcus sp. FPU101]
MKNAISVEHLGKLYHRYHTHKPATIMEAVLSGFRGLSAREKFWALRGINFTVAPGQMLGIIGQNGAGKSTLLQLLGGVGIPNEGKVKVTGRIGALLDLGAGFSPDLTGRENVFVSGVVAGLTRREVARRLEQIVAFAELEDFINNPVRTYSTGMGMRLAFSTAIHTDPDVLLVDEFLSVGDLAFQKKCLERIKELKAQGCAIVLVSHSVDQVRELCDRALWLRQGRVVAYGEAEVVAGQYVSEMRSETQKRTPPRPPQMTIDGIELRLNENRFGSLEVEIVDVQLLPTSHINSGDGLIVEIEYSLIQPIDALIFNVSITQEDGQVCLDINTYDKELMTSIIQAQGKIRVSLERLDLSGGKYFVNVGVYERNWAYAYDFHWHVYTLSVESKVTQAGILSPPCRWEIKNPTSSTLNR